MHCFEPWCFFMASSMSSALLFRVLCLAVAFDMLLLSGDLA
jgi:hypothetical protein